MADAISIIQLIATILGMSSIIIGVIFSLLAIRRNNKTRNLSLFMQYQNRASNKDFLADILEINTLWSWSNLEEFLEKYGAPETFAKFITVGSYFDSMGMLLKTKNISVDFIPELMVISIVEFWEKIESIYREMSKNFRRPESFENIKYLYDEIQKQDLITRE